MTIVLDTFLCQLCQTPSVVDQIWTSVGPPYIEQRIGNAFHRYVANCARHAIVITRSSAS